MSDRTVAQTLLDEKQRAWHEAKELLNLAATEQRDFSAEEEAKYTKINTHIDTLEGRIKDLLEAEQRHQETDAAFNALAGRQQERPNAPAGSDGAAFVEQLKDFLDPDNRAARPIRVESRGSRLLSKISYGSGGKPIDLQNSLEARVLMDSYVGAGTGSGSAVVPVDFYDQLISYLIEVSGLMQTGPSVLNTQGGEPMQIPVVTAHGTATSAAQGAPLPTSDPAFSQVRLSSNKFSVMVQVARELIDDAGLNLLGYLAMQAGRAVGNSVGTSLINGTNGISGGVIAGTNAATVAVTGGISTSVTGSYGGNAITGAPVYDDLVKLQYSVIAPYRQSKSCYWLMADATVGLLRRMRDANQRPIWEPSAVLGSPDLLLGKPLVADPYMPAIGSGATAIAFGDFSQYFVRLVGGVRFERSDDYAFNADLVSFRAVVRADGTFADTAGKPVQLFKGGAS